MLRSWAFFCVGAGLLCLIAARPAWAQCQAGLRPVGIVNSAIPFEYVAGQEYALAQGIGSGYYQYLDFSRMEPPLQPCAGPCDGGTGTGSEYFRCLIERGLGCCVGTTQRCRLTTGVSNGPVVLAVDTLFSNDIVRTEYPVSESNSYVEYLALGGNGSRVLPVPLVAIVPSGCAGGGCWAEVNGFTGFFLKRRLSGSVFYGEFVPLPEVTTSATHSTWGSLKVAYR